MVHLAHILHADLDAFYASVEQLLDPRLRHLPIAVGGSGTGGVVLAASYEARAFGVRGGMSGRMAKQLCPSLRFVSGQFAEYQRLGDAVVAIMHDFTPLVERISIDEAFLDVSGAIHLFGSPADIARALRDRVFAEIGLPLSIGVATTKHLAKVASQVAKPDGLVVVEPGNERAFLEPLPIGLLWGVGPKTEARLHNRGIRTIGELADTKPEAIRHLLGPSAAGSLVDRANNRDDRRVEVSRRARSVGAQSACGRKEPTDEFVVSTLGYLTERVTRRLRSKGKVGRTITVRVRFADLSAVTRSHTFEQPTAESILIRDMCVELTRNALHDHPDERFVSLLGLSVSGLDDADGDWQLAFQFAPTPHRDQTADPDRGRAIDKAIDQICERFGTQAVSIWSTKSAHTGMDDGFRSLAEK